MTDAKRDQEAAQRLMIILCGGDEKEANDFAKLIIRDATAKEQRALAAMYRKADAAATAEARRRGFICYTREPAADPKPLTEAEVAEFDAFMKKVYTRLESEE